MTIETPGRYGWNPSPEHIARVDAEVERMREQSARRRAAAAARKAEAAR